MTPIQASYLKRLRIFVRRKGWDAVRSLDREKYYGLTLARWVYDQRTKRRKGILSREMVNALEKIPGWTWGNYRRDPEFRFQMLKSYLKRHGFDELRQTTVYRGVPIGSWVNRMRYHYTTGRLSRAYVRRLEAIKDWSWEPVADSHRQKAEGLREFVKRRGWEKFSLKVSYRRIPIGRWVERTRSSYRQGTLPKWVQDLAESIPGWRWSDKRG